MLSSDLVALYPDPFDRSCLAVPGSHEIEETEANETLIELSHMYLQTVNQQFR